MVAEAQVVGSGIVIPWTNNSGATKTIGDPVDLEGGLMGVLSSGANRGDTTLAASAVGEVTVQGLVRIDKENGQAWRAGDEVYWDTTNTQGTRFGFRLFQYMGVAARSAAETDTKGYVLLNIQPIRNGNRYEFLETWTGDTIIPTTAAGGRWLQTETGTTGDSKTLTNMSGGALKMLLASTSEAENLCVSHGDILHFDIDQDLVFQAMFHIGANAATTQIGIGMASARNDDLGAIAEFALFRIKEAAQDLLIETDDGSEDNDDKDTTVNLVDDTDVHVAIDFRDTSDVKFYVNGVRVLSASTYDMSNYTGKLQPIMQVYKAATSAAVAYLVNKFIRITGKIAA